MSEAERLWHAIAELTRVATENQYEGEWLSVRKGDFITIVQPLFARLEAAERMAVAIGNYTDIDDGTVDGDLIAAFDRMTEARMKYRATQAGGET
jgi:hypothetical protein